MNNKTLIEDNLATVDCYMSFFEYKTVRELAAETGLDTKEVSKVIKEMLKRGYLLKKGRSYKYPNGRR